MLHAKFQASESSGSEEEYFLIFSYAFLWLKPRTPLGQGPFLTPRPTLEQTW